MDSKISSLVRLGLIILAPIVVGVITFSYLNDAFLKPADPTKTETVLIEIVRGMTFRDVCAVLKEKGILRYVRSIDMLARVKGTNTKSIPAGEYPLSPSMTPSEVLDALVKGKILKRKVVVKEGITIWEVAKEVEAAGLMPKAEFEKALTDPALLVKAGIASSSFEGYLYPETYFYSRPITAQEIIWRMLEEGEKRWTPQYSDQAEKLKMSRHEVLTLASIIEKESGRVEEQPLISSVFHNRLSQGMKLQSDPTVIYGIKNFNGNLTKDDLENADNQYNTYVHYALPQGPIGNPGDTAISAALFPQESTFLYFVADGNGSHIFSSTLREHNDAVERYQKAPARAAAAGGPPAAQPPAE